LPTICEAVSDLDAMRRGGVLFLRCDAHVAEAFNRFARTEVLQLEELANFDLAFLAIDGRIGKAFGPFDRLFPGLRLDDRVARNEFLRFGEGTVDEGAFRAGIPDAPPPRTRLKPGSIDAPQKARRRTARLPGQTAKLYSSIDGFVTNDILASGTLTVL
jgi:hypothetical protein